MEFFLEFIESFLNNNAYACGERKIKCGQIRPRKESGKRNMELKVFPTNSPPFYFKDSCANTGLQISSAQLVLLFSAVFF